jgi:hypothetical protein
VPAATRGEAISLIDGVKISASHPRGSACTPWAMLFLYVDPTAAPIWTSAFPLAGVGRTLRAGALNQLGRGPEYDTNEGSPLRAKSVRSMARVTMYEGPDRAHEASILALSLLRNGVEWVVDSGTP